MKRDRRRIAHVNRNCMSVQQDWLRRQFQRWRPCVAKEHEAVQNLFVTVWHFCFQYSMNGFEVY